jgi:hypothetical protein
MTAMSQRRLRGNGGGTSPMPLRISQNAWGDVKSIRIFPLKKA